MKWSELSKLPNILSLSRPLLFFPLTAIALMWLRWDFVAAVLYGIGTFTDWLDGRLARRKGQVTFTGKLIDPICDKLFFDLVPLFFYLQLPRFLQNLFLFFYLPLELFLILGGLYSWLAPSQSIFLVGANQGGKWKTASIVIFTLLLFANELVLPVPEIYLVAVLSSATGFALMSFVGHVNPACHALPQALRAGKKD